MPYVIVGASAPSMSIVPASDVGDAQPRLRFLGPDVMLPSAVAMLQASDPAHDHDANLNAYPAVPSAGAALCSQQPQRAEP